MGLVYKSATGDPPFLVQNECDIGPQLIISHSKGSYPGNSKILEIHVHIHIDLVLITAAFKGL